MKTPRSSDLAASRDECSVQDGSSVSTAHCKGVCTADDNVCTPATHGDFSSKDTTGPPPSTPVLLVSESDVDGRQVDRWGGKKGSGEVRREAENEACNQHCSGNRFHADWEEEVGGDVGRSEPVSGGIDEMWWEGGMEAGEGSIAENGSRVTFMLAFVVLFAALTGVLMGYDLSIIATVLDAIDTELHLCPPGAFTCFPKQLFVSMIAPGAIVGGLLAGLTADSLGRSSTA
eukprot:GHVQ01022197.1.p1 GENE.GHVQ01022197.1~~GHVQ01022197.1.p1  ORF type:complete len:231 (+),score=41.27 GHVQ01022197.1:540-1232(+)